MKKCPQCNKTYADETLNFCLDDGQWLVADDGAATAILPGAATDEIDGDVTRHQIWTTGGEAEPRISLGDGAERQSFSAHRAAEPQEYRERDAQEHRAADAQASGVVRGFDKRPLRDDPRYHDLLKRLNLPD